MWHILLKQDRIYEYLAHELLASEATAGQTERIMRAVRSLEQIPMRL